VNPLLLGMPLAIRLCTIANMNSTTAQSTTATAGIGGAPFLPMNSGQIKCQLPGHKSQRRSFPLVAFSTLTASTGPMFRRPVRHW
jgi:hypothetical protein